jgi:hypothetical protein
MGAIRITPLTQQKVRELALVSARRWVAPADYLPGWAFWPFQVSGLSSQLVGWSRPRLAPLLAQLLAELQAV